MTPLITEKKEKIINVEALGKPIKLANEVREELKRLQLEADRQARKEIEENLGELPELYLSKKQNKLQFELRKEEILNKLIQEFIEIMRAQINRN